MFLSVKQLTMELVFFLLFPMYLLNQKVLYSFPFINPHRPCGWGTRNPVAVLLSKSPSLCHLSHMVGYMIGLLGNKMDPIYVVLSGLEEEWDTNEKG